MKTLQLGLIAISAVIFAACHSSKKTAVTPAPPVPPIASATPTNTASSVAFTVAKSPNGIYEPGNEELTAIQVQYKDVTLEKLKEGYIIYTMGACMSCHVAQNIYRIDELKWKNIVEDMAQKANISAAQKDAIYKYVLAIKATQAK